ncbi:hypothetical protein C4A76_23910 [Brevibacillus laterosporus]|uniref:hypothetical protein n=1 Tax=Brevibacillus laterosporus TaxID=1465 RepID=UPI000CE3F725|nr:hypothetical protein [Brevibacillus laterosporus]PPA81219.1 hypothetical protein C4A76_23910 [Brevibacillus laterosporus]
MSITKKDKGKNMGETNSKLRREIKDDIIDQIETIGEVRRKQDSILTSPNFHLDSKELEHGLFKVEIQYKSGTKQTVSVVLVNPTAQNVNELRGALELSLKDGYIYEVA